MAVDPVHLSYASPQQWRLLDCLQDRLVQSILACWFIPLAAGVGIFVIYLFTRNIYLEGTGLLALIVGSALAVLGVVLIFIFVISSWRKDDRPLKATLLPALLLLILIASNFAAALAVLRAVNYVDIHYPTKRF